MSDPPVMTVGELTRQLKELLEVNFPFVAVQGEVSNCSRAASGHTYLTLKDRQAQIRAVVWRSAAARLKFEIRDGLEVIATGPVELYPARGTYQLIIDRVVPVGVGALELAFRQMREKLAGEGLFDPERKRPLPAFPGRIAIITSPTGAALRDILQVIARRWPKAHVVIVPVPVQGAGAAVKIAAALRVVHLIPCVDVAVVTRGGGSLEDLWAFNEEVVARAVFDCHVPVICAVGHEIDLSIADLVADRRALTPSEAGELVVPSYDGIRSGLDGSVRRLCNALRKQAAQTRQRLDAIRARRVLLRPQDQVCELARRLDDASERMQRAIRRQHREACGRLRGLCSTLEALSPLRVVARGYSITQFGHSPALVRSVNDVRPGDSIHTLLADGSLDSRVDTVIPRPPFGPTESHREGT